MAKCSGVPDSGAASSSKDDAPAGKRLRPGRAKRAVNWGPWYIAPICSCKKAGGNVIAYGAVCGKHLNADQEPNAKLQCKKYISLCRCRKKLTVAEARRLVKLWLVYGMHLRSTDTERSDHVKFNPRHLHDDTTEADLDALAASLVES